jgi:hypothetical protein
LNRQSLTDMEMCMDCFIVVDFLQNGKLSNYIRWTYLGRCTYCVCVNDFLGCRRKQNLSWVLFFQDTNGLLFKVHNMNFMCVCVCVSLSCMKWWWPFCPL